MSTLDRDREVLDAELVEKIGKGDSRAFAALYDRHHPILFALLLRMIRSRPEAEEILQEVFLRVWQRSDDFDPRRGQPLQWLIMLARSRAIDRLRSASSRDRASRAVGDQPPNPGPDVAQETIALEEAALVRAALSELTEPQREALTLAYFDGFSQSEIAERLAKPLGTVKTQTRLALTRLRESLRRTLGEARPDER